MNKARGKARRKSVFGALGITKDQKTRTDPQAN